MGKREVLDFTVADLLAGGEDVVALSAADGDPDGLWDEAVSWPRPRLTAALVAAVGIIAGDDPPATRDGGGRGRATDGYGVSGHVATCPPVDGR